MDIKIQVDWEVIIEHLKRSSPGTTTKLLGKLDPNYDYSEWGHGAKVQAVILCYLQEMCRIPQ